jgi:hypothetical protein
VESPIHRIVEEGASEHIEKFPPNTRINRIALQPLQPLTHSRATCSRSLFVPDRLLGEPIRTRLENGGEGTDKLLTRSESTGPFERGALAQSKDPESPEEIRKREEAQALEER